MYSAVVYLDQSMGAVCYELPYSGKSLYKGKADYRLCSCQSTLSLAVGKEENKKSRFSKQLIKKLIDNCTSSSQPSPCIEIFLTYVSKGGGGTGTRPSPWISTKFWGVLFNFFGDLYPLVVLGSSWGLCPWKTSKTPAGTPLIRMWIIQTFCLFDDCYVYFILRSITFMKSLHTSKSSVNGVFNSICSVPTSWLMTMAEWK